MLQTLSFHKTDHSPSLSVDLYSSLHLDLQSWHQFWIPAVFLFESLSCSVIKFSLFTDDIESLWSLSTLTSTLVKFITQVTGYAYSCQFPPAFRAPFIFSSRKLFFTVAGRLLISLYFSVSRRWLQIRFTSFICNSDFFFQFFCFIYLFMAVLGLRWCPGFPLVAESKGLLSSWVHRLLATAASLVVEHGSRVRGLQ